MIDIDIPGLGPLRLRHLGLDVNGTLALDGRLIEGVEERLGPEGAATCGAEPASAATRRRPVRQ